MSNEFEIKELYKKGKINYLEATNMLNEAKQKIYDKDLRSFKTSNGYTIDLIKLREDIVKQGGNVPNYFSRYFTTMFI